MSTSSSPTTRAKARNEAVAPRSGSFAFRLAAWFLVASFALGPVSTFAEPARVEADATHFALLAEGEFPSARECRSCHPNHYDEWGVSQHAYAQLSPIFNAMNGELIKRTNGTLGDFCIRCHTPIGMQTGEPVFISNLERSQASREGVTCAVCHRVRKRYGKVNGRIHLTAGPVDVPVSGPTNNQELERILNDPNALPRDLEGEAQLEIHRDVFEFATISSSSFCGTCHDVTSPSGVRLEEAFSEFRHAPAARTEKTCQDCHMGREPGLASGYRHEPAAIVAGKPTRPRKRTDHRFVGPDHSVIHPGLFPFNERAGELASMVEWLQFDWKAGWGTDEFEDRVDDDASFPERWADAADRYDGREILDENLERLAAIAMARRRLLQKGYRLGEVAIGVSARAIEIEVSVKNGTSGHNVPTGFIAERVVWLHAVVRDARGTVLWQSGDLDPNGDVRDGHSRYVRAGVLPVDRDLFTLQSRFVLRNLREGEREEVLAVNDAIDPLPFVRPDPIPNFISGGPAGVRIHKKGIEPGGVRKHRYTIEARSLAEAEPPLELTVELKAGMVPVNLVSEIMGVGFDYGMSAAEVARGVVAGHQVLWRTERTLPALEPQS